MDSPRYLELVRCNVRRLRYERRLTQRELADKVGVSPGHIARLEGAAYKFRNGPTLRELERLADALGVHIHELVAD